VTDTGKKSLYHESMKKKHVISANLIQTRQTAPSRSQSRAEEASEACQSTFGKKNKAHNPYHRRKTK
jgi:hypothetical protein